jgi:hypothetical protein
MDTTRATEILLIVGILIYAAWDIYAASNDTRGDTISEVIYNAAKRRPVIPFALGFLCGHVFFPV